MVSTAVVGSLSFLLGAVAGAAAAILLAPRSGRETREFLAEQDRKSPSEVRKAAGSCQRAHDLASDVQSRAEAWLDRGRDLLEGETRRLRDAFEAGREAMRDEIRRARNRHAARAARCRGAPRSPGRSESPGTCSDSTSIDAACIPSTPCTRRSPLAPGRRGRCLAAVGDRAGVRRRATRCVARSAVGRSACPLASCRRPASSCCTIRRPAFAHAPMLATRAHHDPDPRAPEDASHRLPDGSKAVGDAGRSGLVLTCGWPGRERRASPPGPPRTGSDGRGSCG